MGFEDGREKIDWGLYVVDFNLINERVAAMPIALFICSFGDMCIRSRV